MKDENDGLRKRIQTLSDEELLNMIDRDTQDYTGEALGIARQEANNRGGLETLYERMRLKNELREEPARQSEIEKQPPPENVKSVSPAPALANLFKHTRTLKEETILNEWSMVILQGAGHAQTVLDGIQQKLQASQIPNDCSWSIEEIKSANLLFKTRREFLIVEQEQFKDYHMYIGIRDYGIHLDCCRFLTVEPGFLKKMASEKIFGDAQLLSAPKNILVHQDLRAWATVVHHAVTESVEELLGRLGQDPKLMQKGSKGMLEIW